MNQNKINKNILKNEIEEGDFSLDINKLEVKQFEVNEIENLVNLLDTERIEMILSQEDDSNEIKGITNVCDNYYNKIYFNINKKEKIIKKIKFKNRRFILSTDLDICFNLRNNSLNGNQKEINSITVLQRDIREEK